MIFFDFFPHGFIPGKQRFFLEKFIDTLNREMIPLEIIDPKGARHVTAGGKIRQTLIIKDPKFFKALIAPDAFSLGHAYVKGYFDVSGNIRELYDMARKRFLNRSRPINFFDRIKKKLVPEKVLEKKNIQYHYDLPSKFYQFFLGKTMGYTCGYYSSKDSTMSQAQVQKMDIVCQKLRLKNTDRLLDIGCGWGNLAVHAARHYGVKVTGITLSREQQAYGQKWAANEGLDRHIEIKLFNYRQLYSDKFKASFDKISCVGMSEHVGKANMTGFFQIANHCLKPDGLFLQHTITTNIKTKNGHGNAFLDTYMFPGGELMFEHELVGIAAGTGFELLNAENFRPHYIRTLEDWINRMEINRENLLKMVPEKIFRIYYVFFIGSISAFRDREISLFQNLFYKPGSGSARTDYFSTRFAKNPFKKVKRPRYDG